METAFILWILAVVFMPVLVRRLKQQQDRRSALGDPGSRAPRGHRFPEHRRALPAGEVHPDAPSPFAIFHAEADAHDSDRDEVATDAELYLDEAGREVSREEALEEEARVRVQPRPLTELAASLEQEVDWELEHERFHRRYVDARAAAVPAVHTLLGDLCDDPQALRRAILLAEVLGPPVGDRG